MGHERQGTPASDPEPGFEHSTLRGTVVSGFGDFTRRMTEFPEVFRRVTGENLYPGTINVELPRPVRIREHLRLIGAEIGEPYQDLLFEPCALNGAPAWRIRPLVLDSRAGLPVGEGGHGDHILEISCSRKIPHASPGSEVQIVLFRKI
jgi:hypothetical protein